MGIRDQRIDWIRKRLWIPATNGLGFVANDASGWVGAIDATALLRQISTFGVSGIVMDTAADDLAFWYRVPYDIDPDYPVGFRVAFSAVVTAAGNLLWVVLADAKAHEATIALATTALDTPIVTKAMAATDDNTLEWTSRGIKNLIGLTRAQIEDGAFICAKVTRSTNTGTIGTVNLFGLEMDYVPMKTQGEGSHIDRPLQTDGVA